MGNTRVDTATVRAAAQRFDTAADALGGALPSRLRFDGSVAGRTHATHGDALRSALDRLTAEMVQWSRAAQEIAAALRGTADRYGDAELRAAAR
ncbi:type VII secretion target [Mycobacterium sp. CVI_P3]|uniref:Type VII secretion target n=1 Tax=Mycobacterium pinniadriaticum TaxID=2994102 RepID=A0ABT3SHG4_9MYCO|nr:type VII secretion target [Mycobacterium pinniadriaticum]MCX2932430.1 type VII secretion target [Mycobacterium pinniadriaticum]MCX2938936.1 type VII secretion target [Mycobacterium pinniadriaticum]